MIKYECIPHSNISMRRTTFWADEVHHSDSSDPAEKVQTDRQSQGVRTYIPFLHNLKLYTQQSGTIMDNKSPKRLPTPGKRVNLDATDALAHISPAKIAALAKSETGNRQPKLITITEVKKLNFSTQDYNKKFFARVICLMPSKQHKSQDVHHHRRAIVLADSKDFLRGFIRSNDDDIIITGKCYYFSKFKMFRRGEILIHEESIIWE